MFNGKKTNSLGGGVRSRAAPGPPLHPHPLPAHQVSQDTMLSLHKASWELAVFYRAGMAKTQGLLIQDGGD